MKYKERSILFSSIREIKKPKGGRLRQRDIVELLEMPYCIKSVGREFYKEDRAGKIEGKQST